MIVAALIAAVAAGGGYWAGEHRGAARTAQATNEKKVLYWYDPMSPDQHFDKPGKSPTMDMELVPKYAEADSGTRLSIDPQVSQNLGMRLAKVESGELGDSVQAVATVQFNDRDVAIVQARTAGFVQKVYARAPGDVVAPGAPLADVLVPDWAGAQEEFLAVLRTGDKTLESASRQRLLLLGMPESLIDQVASAGRSQAEVTLTAPISGVIQELGVRSGMTLSQGAMVAKINGLDTVWLEAAVPEAQASALHVGQAAKVSFPAFPGKTFAGKVIALLPEFEASSRTLRVRVELPNRGAALKPGMFAQMQFPAGAGKPVLLVPSEAVIRTGTRNLVMVARGKGQFVPIEVRLGSESGGKTVVSAGLNEGDQVVVSGQFLLDSESSLRGIGTQSPASEKQARAVHQGMGRVESINDREIVISHGPIASLGWSGMTTPFALDSPLLAKDVKPGDTVHFGVVKVDGQYVIETLRKTGGAS